MGKEYQRKVTVEGTVPVAPNIIFYDDIEGSLKWSGVGSGTDWIVDKFAGTKEVNNGNYCLRMWTRTTTPAIGDDVEILRRCTLRTWKITKFSCFFYPETQGSYDFLRFLLGFYDGTNLTFIGVQWKREMQRWEYFAQDDLWYPIPGANQTLYEYAHHYISFTCDFKNKLLKQFQCDELFLDNIALEGQILPLATSSYLIIDILLRSAAAATQKVYIDDILLEEAR